MKRMFSGHFYYCPIKFAELLPHPGTNLTLVTEKIKHKNNEQSALVAILRFRHYHSPLNGWGQSPTPNAIYPGIVLKTSSECGKNAFKGLAKD